MADPWRCPACKTWIRADVTEHRCPPDDAVPAAGTGGGAGGPHPAAAITVTGAPHHLWAQTGSVTTSTSGTTTIPVHVYGAGTGSRLAS
jgi:hypothetical protein